MRADARADAARWAALLLRRWLRTGDEDARRAALYIARSWSVTTSELRAAL